MAQDAYNSASLKATLVERVTNAGGTPAAQWLAKRVEIGVWLDDDPKDLVDLVKYCVHAHAKFYEINAQGVEPDVRYDEIVPILIKGGFNGYLMSEYEGQRLNQDIDPGYDEIDQVTRQLKMVRGLIDKWNPQRLGGAA